MQRINQKSPFRPLFQTEVFRKTTKTPMTQDSEAGFAFAPFFAGNHQGKVQGVLVETVNPQTGLPEVVLEGIE